MRSSILLTAIICLALLSACGKSSPEPSPRPEASPAVTALPLPTPEPTTAPTWEPSAPPAQSRFPYTEMIENPTAGIYKGPSYDSEKYGMVIHATLYTIVEEATDDEGNLWGKLKSGVGWVDLSAARSFKGDIPLVTANFADMNQIRKGSYKEFYPEERYDWATLADIRVTSPASELQLVMLEPLEYTISEVYHTIPSLEPFEPFVSELYFSGDFTTYGLSLLDEGGSRRMFAISQSGRNGELVVREVTEYTYN